MDGWKEEFYLVLHSEEYFVFSSMISCIIQTLKNNTLLGPISFLGLSPDVVDLFQDYITWIDTIDAERATASPARPAVVIPHPAFNNSNGVTTRQSRKGVRAHLTNLWRRMMTSIPS